MHIHPIPDLRNISLNIYLCRLARIGLLQISYSWCYIGWSCCNRPHFVRYGYLVRPLWVLIDTPWLYSLVIFTQSPKYFPAKNTSNIWQELTRNHINIRTAIWATHDGSLFLFFHVPYMFYSALVSMHAPIYIYIA